MFARNLLQAGEYVTMIPVGIPVTLQYDENGSIERVWRGYDYQEELTDIMLVSLLKNKQVPNKITVKGGTSYVRGVLHTFEQVANSGMIPECMIDSLISIYESDPTSFSFYAGHVDSLVSAFRGAVAIRQWLTFAGFNLLPGYVVPGTDFDKFEQVVKTDYPFRYPMIAYFMKIKIDGKAEIVNTGLKQYVVNDVKIVNDTSGNILGQMSTTDSDSPLMTRSYIEVYAHQISEKTVVVEQSDGQIVFTYPSDGKFRKVANKIQCPSCNKIVLVPNVGNSLKCDDSHCNSVLYLRVVQMLRELNLPEMSFETYKTVTAKIGNIFSLLDVFDLPEYKDIKIEVTPQQLLRAFVPKEILPSSQSIAQFVGACNSSPEVICYYVQNPQMISSDLALDMHVFTKFINWINNAENCSDIVEAFDLANVTIRGAGTKFEGAPIFRDKKIMITGTFMHGDHESVASIIRSYGAEVDTHFDPTQDCLVVGDIPENVNGHAVNEAKKYGVKIMSESEFFQAYDIDSDLAQNL
ncbi:MAG: hypothetical protein IJE78_04860 [Bacteroidaceae bacterium]|nr:hypothetical protein [Bacteroidaceae bacterium]